MALEKIESKNYITILASDATFRKVVPDGTEGAVVREYETSDGSKGKKTELVYNRMRGVIKNVAVVDGKFSKLIEITISDEAGDMLLSLDVNHAYAEDFMKKLPNIDLKKEVVLVPFNFDDESGKNKKGLSITQDDVKIQNYYYNPAEKKNINGFPTPEGDTSKFDSDDWKMYFMKVRKFLIQEVQDKFNKEIKPDEITEDDINKIVA